jgi:hypothetical protein
MPEKEVLDFKPAPRLEQIDDKRPKQMEDRKQAACPVPSKLSAADSRQARRVALALHNAESELWPLEEGVT